MLQDLYARWPFFRTVLSNMAQVMAKADMGLAARYSELVEDEALRHRVFDKIVAEHDRTIAMPSSSPDRTTCWPTTRRWPVRCSTGSPTWSRSTTCRSSCCAGSASGDADELVQRGILLTMSGLATALRNSG